MNNKELVRFLKDNLKIELTVREVESIQHDGHIIKIRLVIRDEEIATSEDLIINTKTYDKVR